MDFALLKFRLHARTIWSTVSATPYSDTGHLDCIVYSQQGSDGIPSLPGSSPLDSDLCRSAPAASTVSHSSDNERLFPGTMRTQGHMPGIHHLVETLWRRRQKEENNSYHDGVWLWARRERNERKAPLTLHHTHSILQVEPAATALALLGVLAHCAPFGAVLTEAGQLVGKRARWTMWCAGLLSGQETTWRKTDNKYKKDDARKKVITRTWRWTAGKRASCSTIQCGKI